MFKIKKKNLKKRFFRKKHFTFLKYLNNFNKKCRLNQLRIKKKTFRFFKKFYRYHLGQKTIHALKKKNKSLKKIKIKFYRNNIYFSLINLKNNKTIKSVSSGIYSIKTSKKKLKFVYKTLIDIFFVDIKKYFNNYNNTIFEVSVPLSYRKKVYRILKKKIKVIKKNKLKQNKLKQNKLKQNKLKKNSSLIKKRVSKNILISIIPKKCYNGCKAKKKLRKKRRLFRIYK